MVVEKLIKYILVSIMLMTTMYANPMMFSNIKFNCVASDGSNDEFILIKEDEKLSFVKDNHLVVLPYSRTIQNEDTGTPFDIFASPKLAFVLQKWTRDNNGHGLTTYRGNIIEHRYLCTKLKVW